MEQPDWLSGQKEGNSPLPKVILLCCENSRVTLACPEPSPGRSQPFPDMGLLPVTTPSTSFPSYLWALLMRVCHLAPGLSHPQKQQVSSSPSNCFNNCHLP